MFYNHVINFGDRHWDDGGQFMHIMISSVPTLRLGDSQGEVRGVCDQMGLRWVPLKMATFSTFMSYYY